MGDKQTLGERIKYFYVRRLKPLSKEDEENLTQIQEELTRRYGFGEGTRGRVKVERGEDGRVWVYRIMNGKEVREFELVREIRGTGGFETIGITIGIKKDGKAYEVGRLRYGESLKLRNTTWEGIGEEYRETEGLKLKLTRELSLIVRIVKLGEDEGKREYNVQVRGSMEGDWDENKTIATQKKEIKGVVNEINNKSEVEFTEEGTGKEKRISRVKVSIPV